MGAEGPKTFVLRRFHGGPSAIRWLARGAPFVLRAAGARRHVFVVFYDDPALGGAEGRRVGQKS